MVLTTSFAPTAMKLPLLPRLGVRLSLPARFDCLTWYGRGPHENYCDRQESARVGVYSGSVQEQFVPYVKPQENGNKGDVRWATLTDGRGQGLLAAGLPLFACSAHHFTAEDFTGAPHLSDLKPRAETVLNLDWRQGGLGSNSCGPGVLPQYQLLLEAPVEFAVRLRPFSRETDDPMTLGRARFG